VWAVAVHAEEITLLTIPLPGAPPVHPGSPVAILFAVKKIVHQLQTILDKAESPIVVQLFDCVLDEFAVVFLDQAFLGAPKPSAR
jgi:hypothetical protein